MNYTAPTITEDITYRGFNFTIVTDLVTVWVYRADKIVAEYPHSQQKHMFSVLSAYIKSQQQNPIKHNK